MRGSPLLTASAANRTNDLLPWAPLPRDYQGREAVSP
jgi:hypothetical protein